MDLLIEKYKNLDPLNTIIFWGIIIIILLIIFVLLIFIRKNKKNKQTPDDTSSIELPVINNDTLIMKDDDLLIQEEKSEAFIPFEIKKNDLDEKKVEIEKQFIAEEHIMEYDKEMFNIPNMKKNNEPKEELKKEPFIMPTKPYERNVLKEISSSQTSPIGIIKNNNEEIIINENVPKQNEQNSIPLEEPQIIPKIDLEVTDDKKEDILEEEKIKFIPEEKKEDISLEIIPDKIEDENIINEKKAIEEEAIKEPINNDTDEIINNIEIEKTDNNIEKPQVSSKESRDNEIFLEEVSKKLSEADISNDIERTAYEIKQEEEAIISYKELMEKKDTIQTVDEEDAVISIEELIQRKKEEEQLYNITDREGNDDFINELKKFRSDL